MQYIFEEKQFSTNKNGEKKTLMFVDFGLCPRSRCRCAVIYIKLARSALMLLSLLLRLPFSPSSSNVPRDLRHLFTLSWPQIGAK